MEGVSGGDQVQVSLPPPTCHLPPSTTTTTTATTSTRSETWGRGFAGRRAPRAACLRSLLCPRYYRHLHHHLRKLQPYDRAGLETIFSKYGDVTAVVVNAKKGGSALVEFASLREAKMAAAIEQGLPANKLSVKPLWEEEVSNRYCPWHPLLSNGCLSNDFESLVMRRLRQEEERKRLIAEMEREDREGS